MLSKSTIADLLEKIEIEYRKSDIALTDPGKYYSLSSTRLIQNAPLLLGFNWGSSGGHSPQTIANFPKNSFLDLLNTPGELGSFARVGSFLEAYLPDVPLDKYVQSNFCFFRSKKDGDISPNDLLATTPIFIDFLKHLEPSSIISFSSRLYEYLSGTDMLINVNEKHFPSRNRNAWSRKGTLKYDESQVSLYFLPHPNYPITGDARKACWEFCFPASYR